MTDAAFVLQETNSERSIIKKSAQHKKGGSKSKMCSLPSDRLTKKELEAKNGPINCWKLTDFYTWEQFKLMPQDIQIEWLNRLIDTYGVGLQVISVDAFNMSHYTLNKYLENHKIADKIHKGNLKKSKQPEGSRKLREDIRKFWEGDKGEQMENVIKLEYSEGTEKFIAENDIHSLDESDAKIPDGMKPIAPTVNAIMSPGGAIKDIPGFVIDKEAINHIGYKPEDPVTKKSLKKRVFSTSYISDEIDLSEIYMIQGIFADQKVKVTIEVEAL